MKQSQLQQSGRPPLLRLFLLSFLVVVVLLPPVLLLLLLLLRRSTVVVVPAAASSAETVAVVHNPVHDDLKIRPVYTTYESYIQRQLNKTLNPKLRMIWSTRDWDRKVRVFSGFFDSLKRQRLLSNSSKALCIGARVGQEVAALRSVGVADSIGIDLVPHPPLVVEGDFHSQPFPDDTFDLEFSNVFDHALYPDRFVGEIERTLKPGGVCVLHVALDRRADKYSANDLFSIEPLLALFKRSDVVHVRKVDGFGLDTEVVFRKNDLIRRR